MVGNRKFKATLANGAYLVIAFAICGFCELPAEMFWAFAAGIGGQQGAFVWGNAKEHEAKIKTGGGSYDGTGVAR